MGVETPIPPVAMNAAAPDGAPPRRINYCTWDKRNENFDQKIRNVISSLSKYAKSGINRTAQRGPDEAAERPPKGVGTLASSTERTTIFLNVRSPA